MHQSGVLAIAYSKLCFLVAILTDVFHLQGVVTLQLVVQSSMTRLIFTRSVAFMILDQIPSQFCISELKKPNFKIPT